MLLGLSRIYNFSIIPSDAVVYLFGGRRFEKENFVSVALNCEAIMWRDREYGVVHKRAHAGVPTTTRVERRFVSVCVCLRSLVSAALLWHTLRTFACGRGGGAKQRSQPSRHIEMGEKMNVDCADRLQ